MIRISSLRVHIDREPVFGSHCNKHQQSILIMGLTRARKRHKDLSYQMQHYLHHCPLTAAIGTAGRSGRACPRTMDCRCRARRVRGRGTNLRLFSSTDEPCVRAPSEDTMRNFAYLAARASQNNAPYGSEW